MRESEEGEEEEIDRVEDAHARIDALSQQISELRDLHADERQARVRLEDDLAAERERRYKLQDDLDEIDARTDLLSILKADADQMDGRARSAALILHLKRAAERRRERGDVAKASVNRDQAEEALHHPDVERTTIYRDMRRAVRLVDDKRVLAYESASGGESRLKLDLENGDLPGEATLRRGDDL